jgi:hypothetical protein
MQSPVTTRASFSVDEDTLDEFDDLADAEEKSRSEKLRELVERAVSDGADGSPDEYLPGDATAESVYLACLEYAQMPEHLLRFTIHKGEIAQASGVG